MTSLNNACAPRFGQKYAPSGLLLRMGTREMVVCRDFRKRFYAVNPLIECDTGTEAGHVEVLLMRRWLLILSKAH